MKMALPKIFASILFSSLIVGHAFAQTVPLVVAADSYIDGRDSFRDTNFGSGEFFQVGNDGTSDAGALGGQKAYFLIDASASQPVLSIESFEFRRAGGTVNRTVRLWAILDANPWTETGITWNNAPGNNVVDGHRNFGAHPGETLIDIGFVSIGSVGDATITITPNVLTESNSLLLLDALNSGDRTLTLGLAYNSSQANVISFRAREFEGGTDAPRLNVVIPEPGTYAIVFGGLVMLLAIARRRFLA